MSRKWIAVLCSSLTILALPALAALIEYQDGSGKTWGAGVLGYINGSGQAQSVSATTPLPVSTTANSLTIVALRIATVTTGGTAVTALNPGDRTKGGFLVNPENATINLCVNEQSTAAGTVSAGALICVGPSQAYTLAPSDLGVSVISSDSAHPFAGQGYN